MNGIVIGGPTGSGKTRLSIKLAKVINGEIISADSAQLYKGLDIGTAKITEKEKDGIIHHMIDIVAPVRKFNVGTYQRKVDEILNESEKKKRNILIVGGTGLYINAVTNGLASLPEGNPMIRENLSKYNNKELYEQLFKVDKVSAENIHINNRVRLERALEVYKITGEKFSELSVKNIKGNNYDFTKIALDCPRDILYKKIDQRVDMMIEKGLLEEVKQLYNEYGSSLKKLNIIGYNEIIDFFQGKLSLNDALLGIKQNSRRYAKRQITWFRNDKSFKWYNLYQMTEEEIIDDILHNMKKNNLSQR
ncbi:tRNA (adenosine(37)-N6)-dimethylallyltransferase MiaA [Fusobacterium sp. PH5-44]|uniref:tRNA (adenosine(37)-N6)-dimethylallyltransferase MiaA n=1 Tax=unclassified Fusobacterium TaxID=2648384 RepID=UPI003D23F5F9